MNEAEILRAETEQRRYETIVREHLDQVLNPRGFRLSSQQGFGVDLEGRVAHAAVYEADPDDYAIRYPALRAKFDGDVPCVDLWVKRDPVSGRLGASLEGDDLLELLAEVGPTSEESSPSESPANDLERQLNTLGEYIARVLDHFAV